VGGGLGRGPWPAAGRVMFDVGPLQRAQSQRENLNGMNGVAVSSDGISIRYEVHGSGEPALVFVHGWSCDRTYWSGQLDHFAESHRVVAIDLAGHGKSGTGRDDWTMPAFGDDVVAVVEQLALGTIVLIGHSMGGDAIVDAANRLRGQVVGLVWVDVYTSLGHPRSPEEIEAFMVPFREDFAGTARGFFRQMFGPDAAAALVDRVVEDVAAAPPEVALGAMAHAIGNDERIVACLGEVTAPVVAINPDRRRTDVEGLAQHGITTVVMPGVGHFLMMEDPETFNRLLGEVVEKFTG
jgi:pimeloyl-ACP methyl ester carboxylesterase